MVSLSIKRPRAARGIGHLLSVHFDLWTKYTFSSSLSVMRVALVASSGVFLSSPEFLGTKNESYYWDNEPFNGLCVDLSAGASEANPKI